MSNLSHTISVQQKSQFTLHTSSFSSYPFFLPYQFSCIISLLFLLNYVPSFFPLFSYSFIFSFSYSSLFLLLNFYFLILLPFCVPFLLLLLRLQKEYLNLLFSKPKENKCHEAEGEEISRSNQGHEETGIEKKVTRSQSNNIIVHIVVRKKKGVVALAKSFLIEFLINSGSNADIRTLWEQKNQGPTHTWLLPACPVFHFFNEVSQMRIYIRRPGDAYLYIIHTRRHT